MSESRSKLIQDKKQSEECPTTYLLCDEGLSLLWLSLRSVSLPPSPFSADETLRGFSCVLLAPVCMRVCVCACVCVCVCVCVRAQSINLDTQFSIGKSPTFLSILSLCCYLLLPFLLLLPSTASSGTTGRGGSGKACRVTLPLQLLTNGRLRLGL